MRIASWNMAHKAPARYRGKLNRRRQWALLGALGPDVALLQECTAEDLETFAPAWVREEYELIGHRPSLWRGSALILARQSLEPEQILLSDGPDGEHRWGYPMRENIAMARIRCGETHLLIASVYADARVVDNPLVTEADHQQMKRPSLSRAWTCDWVAAVLASAIPAGPFLIGGDRNEARLFDVTEPKSAPASQEFFDGRLSAGWHDVMRRFDEDEVRTFLGSPRSFELDHFFADSGTLEAVSSCRVIDDPEFLELSDHKVLLAEIDEAASLAGSAACDLGETVPLD